MIKRILFTFFAATLLAVVATGCNTVEGAAEDVESTGEAIQDTVD